MVSIKLNDTLHQVSNGTTLAEFVRSIGLIPDGIAVAVDFEVIPKEKWTEFVLIDQLELMMIHAVSGG
jgi:sulfur carrier protein